MTHWAASTRRPRITPHRWLQTSTAAVVVVTTMLVTAACIREGDELAAPYVRQQVVRPARNASRRGGVQAVRGALPTPLVLGPGPAAQRRNTGSGAAGARRPRRDRVRVADQYRAVQGRLATRSGLEPSRWRATARIQIGCP